MQEEQNQGAATQGVSVQNQNASLQNARVKFNPEEIGKRFDDLSKKLDKNEVQKVEETATYFDPEEGVEYLLLLESKSHLDTVEKETGQEKKVPAIFFYAKKKGEKGDAKRFIDASTVSVKNLSRILDQNGPFGCYVSLTMKGQVGNGSQKYNDYNIFSIPMSEG